MFKIRRLAMRFGLLCALAVSAVGCHSYSGIARTQDHVYLTGSTNFLFFGTNWVKKCNEKNGRLYCAELDVREGRLLRDASE
jgi:hypothetical protein